MSFPKTKYKSLRSRSHSVRIRHAYDPTAECQYNVPIAESTRISRQNDKAQNRDDHQPNAPVQTNNQRRSVVSKRKNDGYLVEALFQLHEHQEKKFEEFFKACKQQAKVNIEMIQSIKDSNTTLIQTIKDSNTALIQSVKENNSELVQLIKEILKREEKTAVSTSETVEDGDAVNEMKKNVLLTKHTLV